MKNYIKIEITEINDVNDSKLTMLVTLNEKDTVNINESNINQKVKIKLCIA